MFPEKIKFQKEIKMAYISKEEVKVIRNEIKKAFPAKDGWKFSVVTRNYSEVDVAIVQAPKEYGFEGHESINQYHIESNYNEKQAEMLSKVYAIMSKEHWDESDSMTDYFHCAYYMSMSIGKWDKDCKAV